MRPLILLVVATLVVAGCGGGDGELSKEEFTAEAEAICADARGEVGALGARPTDPGRLADWWLEFVAIGETALEELRALSPAARERETVSEMLSALENTFVATADYAAAIRADDSEKAAEASSRGIEHLRAAQESGREYGLKECLLAPGVG